jgi:hypothetical protein
MIGSERKSHPSKVRPKFNTTVLNWHGSDTRDLNFAGLLATNPSVALATLLLTIQSNGTVFAAAK